MDTTFEQRLDAIRGRISAACGRAGRDAAGVMLLPVSKNFGPGSVAEAAGCGLLVFGESRVQEARQKIPLCPGNLTWHMIGHLQRNKARDAASLFSMIHSIDSLRLLEAVESAQEEAGTPVKVLVEVNVSGESSKHGVTATDLPAVLDAANRLVRVEIAGLMTIPPFTEDPEDARPVFRKLRELRDEMRRRTGLRLDELSMGMSHDFEVAIEEGSTCIRVGSALFGERKRLQDG